MNAAAKRARPAVRATTTKQSRRKNIRLDQQKLDQARKILGAATETETIEQALDLVLFQERAVAGMARLVGKGGFQNAFDDDLRP